MSRKVIGICAAIILAIGLIGSMITLPSTMNVARGEKIVETVSAEEIDDLLIKSDYARIIVEPTTEDDIKVVYNKRKDTSTPLEVENKGSSVTVTIENQSRMWFNFGIFPFNETLKLSIPEKDYNRLTIQNKNGTINVQDIHAQNVTAHSNNGAIVLQNVVGEHAEVSTNNGTINISGVTGEVIGKTKNGIITLETDDLDRPIDLETNNGKITILTAKEPTNTLFDVNVGNGTVTVFGKSNWDTIIGDGENTVRVAADNGLITIKK